MSASSASDPDAFNVLHGAEQGAPGAPPAESRRWRRFEPTLAVLAVLLVLELSSRSGVLPPQEIPPVSVVLASLVQDLQQAKLWDAIVESFTAWGVGMLVVIGLAVPVGILMGASRRVYESTIVTVEFLRTIPSVAALPLLIFLYGIGFNLTVMLVVLASIWPLLLQTMYGMHDVDPVLVASGRVYGLSKTRSLLLITLPSIAPYVATGLRLSATIALVVAIAVSLVVGGEGLGNLIGSAAQSGQVPLMYARILVAGLLGLLLTAVLRGIEKRLLHWHVSHREVTP